MTYQPFLIAPYQTGLELDLEPWLSPADAFREIKNGHIHHGVLEKRRGFVTFGYFTRDNGTKSPTNITGITTGSPPVVSVAAGTNPFQDGDEVIIYGVIGMPEINAQARFTVANRTTNDFELLGFETTSTYTSGGVIALHKNAADDPVRIMGIKQRYASPTSKNILIFSKLNAAIYTPSVDAFTPLDATPIFSSDDDDFVWAENYAHSGATATRLYFTNGKAFSGGTDGLQYYETGSTTTRFQPDINGTSNALEGAKIIFAVKQKLLLLSTFEDGSEFRQRARWCQPRVDPTTSSSDQWDDDVPGKGGFVDAPTGEYIVSAQRLQDIIIVEFTESVWTLRPTPNPALPFRWDRINSFRSTGGLFANNAYDRTTVNIGIRGITATDGVETKRIDERIEEFVTERLDASLDSRIYGARSYGFRRSWYLYPDIIDNGEVEDPEVNNALIYDEESKSWSLYRIAMNVLGYGGFSQSAQIDDPIFFGKTIDLPEFEGQTIRDYRFQSNEDNFLGGDRDGTIFLLEQSTDDNGESIRFEMESASWNFFKDQGVAAHLGYVDFNLDVDPTRVTAYEVNFYKDADENPYQTQIIDNVPDQNYLSDVTDVNIPPSTSISGIALTTPPTVTVGSTSEFSDGDQIFISGITGTAELNGNYYLVTNKTTTTIDLQNLNGTDVDASTFTPYTSGGTVYPLALVDSPNHGIKDGQIVYIYGVKGTNEINGIEITATFYENDDSINSFRAGQVDPSGFSAYTTNGKVYENRITQSRTWKRAFADGIGYQHRLRITEESDVTEIRIPAMRAWARPVGVRQIG